MLYVRAQDTPSAEVLREKPRVAEEKTKWFQDHDQHAGNLYGLLPLALGMPGALTTSIGIPINSCCEGRSVSCTLGYWKTESRWSTRTDKRC